GVSVPLLAAFAILQGLRLWVLLSLGRYWTTRIITVPGAPLVRRGPYRFLRHPNYLVVAAEIAMLPLAFGAWVVAVVFSALNAALLAWRIALEDQALAPRRQVSHTIPYPVSARVQKPFSASGSARRRSCPPRPIRCLRAPRSRGPL